MNSPRSSTRNYASSGALSRYRTAMWASCWCVRDRLTSRSTGWPTQLRFSAGPRGPPASPFELVLCTWDVRKRKGASCPFSTVTKVSRAPDETLCNLVNHCQPSFCLFYVGGIFCLFSSFCLFSACRTLSACFLHAGGILAVLKSRDGRILTVNLGENRKSRTHPFDRPRWERNLGMVI